MWFARSKWINALRAESLSERAERWTRCLRCKRSLEGQSSIFGAVASVTPAADMARIAFTTIWVSR